MAVVSLPRALYERLTEEGASALRLVLSEVEDDAVARALEIVEERFERRLSEEISKLRGEFQTEIGKLRLDFTTETAKLRSEMAQMEARVIKWMFIFWVGQVGTITAILFAFFKR